MSDIFNLFNLTEELDQQKKAEEQRAAEEKKKQQEEATKKRLEEQKAKVSTKPAAKPEPKADEFKPNEDTVIRFHSEHIEITQYFSTEELAEGLLVQKKDGTTERTPLTGELLRARMENDFPELIKGMTEVVYLKAKNMIVIIMVAKKKGCMECVVQEEEQSKIPFDLLQQFINMAKYYAFVGKEVHADIYYSNSYNAYFMDIPEQVVDEHWVEVVESAFSIAQRIEDATKVCEIHSHHLFEAFFSVQDDESERVPGMYYVVVGRVEDYFPSIKARIFIDGKHEDISVERLFTSPFVRQVDTDAKSNIKLTSLFSPYPKALDEEVCSATHAEDQDGVHHD